MVYEEWEKTAPSSMKIDLVWKVTACRHALFLRDLFWEDISSPLKDKRTISIADQLYRAVSSIGANIAEGYSCSTGKDRVLFYQCALGSTREARDWYYKGRYILGKQVFEQRLKIISEFVRLLVTMIPQQRGYLVREDVPVQEIE
jgi:four helix bundle protein